MGGAGVKGRTLKQQGEKRTKITTVFIAMQREKSNVRVLSIYLQQRVTQASWQNNDKNKWMKKFSRMAFHKTKPRICWTKWREIKTKENAKPFPFLAEVNVTSGFVIEGRAPILSYPIMPSFLYLFSSCNWSFLITW